MSKTTIKITTSNILMGKGITVVGWKNENPILEVTPEALEKIKAKGFRFQIVKETK